jgi:hypothetical protein
VKSFIIRTGKLLFENGELRRVFGLKRDEVTREWINLHDEVLHDRYCSPTIIG